MMDNVESPMDSTPTGGLPSPWASIVRGGGADQNFSAVSPPERTSSADKFLIEGLEIDNYHNSGRQMRSVWNILSDGVVDSDSVIGGVVSWPALSESKQPILRSLSDGSSSSTKDPIISHPPQRSVADNPPAITISSPMSMRSESMDYDIYDDNQLPISILRRRPYYKVAYGMYPSIYDFPLSGPRPVGATQSQIGSNDHSQMSNSRRGGYGGRPRGDGLYYNNHCFWLDQYMPPAPIYMPPPPMPPFLPPAHMRGYGQMGFEAAHFFYAMPPPEAFRSVPIVPPPAPLFSNANETLTNMIVKQVDFYFSNDNLAKDQYLRNRMNNQGWVSVHLIATFPLIKKMKTNIPVILEALRHSTVVEVQGENVRRRTDWKKWLNSPNATGSNSPTTLANSLERVSLDDAMTKPTGGMNHR